MRAPLYDQTERSMADKPETKDADEPQADKLTLLQMVGSTVSAALGVQSSSNRKRDFSKGKAVHFIIMGIAFTAVFVLAVVGVVNLVLS